MKFIKLMVAVIMSLVITVISVIPAFAVQSDVQSVSLQGQDTWQNSYFNSVLGFDKNAMRDYTSYSDFVNYTPPLSSVSNDFSRYIMDDLNSFFIYNTEKKIGYIAFFDNDIDYVPPNSSGYLQIIFKDCHCIYAYTVSCSSSGRFVFKDFFNSADEVHSRGFFTENEDFLRSSIIISDDCLSSISLPCVNRYYSNNICYQFIEWLKSDEEDSDDYDILNPLRHDSTIKYYDCLNHSNLYSSGLDKYLCSTADFYTNGHVYYSKDHLDDISINGDVEYDQKQLIRIYMLLDEEVQRKIKAHFIHHKINNDIDKSSIDDPELLNSIYEDINSFGTYHYYKVQGSINFQSWVSTFSFSDERIKVYNDKYYYTFCMPDYYTLLPRPNNDVFLMGYKTVVNLPKADFANDPSNVGGVGSRLDDATNGIPSKSDLIKQGFKNGYPNDKGDFPYCITISQNGEVYQKWYFKNKPKLNSWYYSDKCIRYTANVSTSVGYVYIPARNVSYEFDFSELDGVTGETINKIIDGVGAGLTVTAIATGENIPLAVVSVVVDLISLYDFSGLDIGTIKNKTFDFWTNYSGTADNYIGYIVTFNWSLDSGALIKNNSDDNYDYNQVYKNDKPITEQATDANGTLITGNNYYYTYNYYYSDNNGNVHGGGDETYIPTEPPTASQLVYENSVSDLDFNASTLSNYTNNVFAFIGRAFTFLPTFIWVLVCSGIVLVIALRLLGR